MNVIIVGSGKVGFNLAEQLTQESHSVTILDYQEGAIQRVSDMLDVMAVRGNGVSAEILQQAGAPAADLLVAATGSDEVNMVCCLTAKNLGTKHTIARIRNPEYTRSLVDLRRNLKIDTVINPENTTAVEITRLLRFPAAANIETFCRGRVELMGFRLQEGDFLLGKPLHALPPQVKKLSMLFCAADRDGVLSIPNGGFVPQVGDKLYMVGQPASLDQFFHLLGRYAPKVKNVFLLGGGKISMYLANILDRMGMRLTIVEQNGEKCRTISERFPRATVICGDGTDQELLETERFSAFDAFVALTDRDEDNLIISLYAMQQGLPKIIAKCNRENYISIARAVGLDSVISPKFITSSHILHLVRGMQNSQGSVMNSLHRIADGKAEAMEFTVGPSARYLGVPLKELRLKPGILIAVIVRDRDIIIPEGSSYLTADDSVILIAQPGTVLDLNDIYQEEPRPAGGSAQ